MRYLNSLLLVVLGVNPVYAAEITFVETQNSGDTFVYEGSLEFNQKVETGSFIAIYDVGGLVSGTGPANWHFTMPVEAPGLPNDSVRPDALFTYDGPPIVGVQGELSLGNFYLTGAFNGQREGLYLTRTIRVGSGNNTGTLLDQSATTTVPIPPVPEPSTAILFITGLSLTLGHRFGRRRVSAVNTQATVR
jgi:hypothetical protein